MGRHVTLTRQEPSHEYKNDEFDNAIPVASDKFGSGPLFEGALLIILSILNRADYRSSRCEMLKYASGSKGRIDGEPHSNGVILMPDQARLRR